MSEDHEEIFGMINSGDEVQCQECGMTFRVIWKSLLGYPRLCFCPFCGAKDE